MSKERARRRAEREREAAIRQAARAAEAERRERRRARQQRVHSAFAWMKPRPAVGRQSGVLARRTRRRTRLLLGALLLLNVAVWWLRPEWEAVLASIVVSALAFPVLRLFVVSRR